MRRVLLLSLLSGLCLLGQQPDSSLLQQYFQEGQKALTEGRYGEAARAFEKVRELDPGVAEVHASLGFSYFQQGKFRQAASAMREALKLNPKLQAVDAILAMSLAELGDYEEALPGLKKAFQSAPDPALQRSAGLRLQRAYTGLERDDKALEVALELIRLHPEDPEILYHAGRVAGNFAYLSIRKLAEIGKGSVWAHLAAGDAFESQGQHRLAIAEYRKVLDLDPHRPGVHFRLGRALLSLPAQANAQADALQEFEKELELDPTNANAAYEAAEIHRKLGRFEQARELFQLAIKHYPDFEEARVGMGKALIALEKPERALPHLQKAIQLDPENEVAYYRLAQVHRELGNSAGQKEALANFRRLRSRSPRQDLTKAVLSPRDVTQQELDSEPAP